MEYRKKKTALMIENLGIVFMLAFTLFPTNWLFRGIVVILLFLLIKDQIVNRNYHIKTDEKGFYEIKGKKEIFMPYDEIEFITISRKYKKHIAIGNATKMFLIRNSMENRKQLVEYILLKSKKNKGIYIDEHVNMVLDKY
ncbi:MAG: hypothetical protein U9Q80_07665 [Bacillota bacterium]|nr:hypothetical protein [Bacillota bacterium]